jgi:hypothetical protein
VTDFGLVGHEPHGQDIDPEMLGSRSQVCCETPQGAGQAFDLFDFDTEFGSWIQIPCLDFGRQPEPAAASQNIDLSSLAA